MQRFVVRSILVLTFALAVWAALAPATYSFADGSDPMPLCRGKGCPK